MSMLTAEQVADAVLDNFEETHETYHDHWEPSKFDWQAIADELNAALGIVMCELHECEGSFSAINRPVWRCDCGAFMTQYTDATNYHKPRYCPNCGRKVVER